MESYKIDADIDFPFYTICRLLLVLMFVNRYYSFYDTSSSSFTANLMSSKNIRRASMLIP